MRVPLQFNKMNGNSIPQTYHFHEKNASNDQKFVHFNDDELRYRSLKEAIVQKDRGTIIWLINEGCPINITDLDKDSDTPLHVAVLADEVDTARVLIAAGAQVNAFNSQKQTPLHLAFELGNKKMVDLLLSQCDGKINPFTVYGLSHFHIACVRNNWRVAHAFLERGVNANVYLEKCFYGKDYAYHRPLHLAVKYENLEVTEMLLKYGANVDAKDKYKRTPLHLACRYNYKRICERIRTAEIETPEDVLRLIRAENDQVDIVKALTRFGATIEALDLNDTPPLFHIFKCDYEEVKNAIRKRINIEDEDFWNEVVEVFKGIQREKFHALMMRNADVKFCDGYKETLLHLVIDGKRLFTHCRTVAVKERDLDDEAKAEIVDLLLKYGAEVDAKNANGQTALQMAISSYYVKTVHMLLNHYAAVNNICFFHYKIPKKETGKNFDLTEMENFLDIISLILKRKSDLNITRINELLMLRYMSMDSNVQHFENCSTVDLRHLLDFGDINCMDVSFYTSERSILSNREKISLLLEHIQKLEIAGLYVNEDIKREFLKCDKIMGARQEACSQSFIDRCKDEIEKLKVIMIDRYASFYDLLFLNTNEIAVRVKSSGFRQSIRMNCNVKFSLYSAMIIKQFVKGMVRSILLETVKEYMSFIMISDLPDPCSESVLSHLSNEDLCNLALAFEK